ncbi:MAG: ribonuclease Y, partial [Candidatus Caldatribacteriota bacterium]|nr:ribonuclease Y [Candidatus Caldatribacteriota bacterium]
MNIIIGLAMGYILTRVITKSKITSAETNAKNILDHTKREAESLKKEIAFQAKEEAYKTRRDAENDIKCKRFEIQKFEDQLVKKSNNLVQKMESLEKRERSLNYKDQELEKNIQKVKRLHQDEKDELLKISKMTQEEAKKELMGNLEKELSHETGKMIKEMEERAKSEADKKSRNIISLAIQRFASDHTVESTTSFVPLPNEDMKGRIIGREGRNIKTFEMLTGVDLIVDDTPEAVIISGFDPIRREIARISLEKLIIDGRIQPAKIEEVIEKSKTIVENNIKETGERIVFDTNIKNISPKIVNLLGKLKYRTSYGQNVLQHSKEVSYLAEIMASEIGANAQLAKRSGLLHDIGKAIDHEVEGTHAAIGAEIARKNGESFEVINAIASHHADVEPKTVEAVLVQAADAISASRPGARREMLETYIKRLEKLEEIANSFEGVEKSYDFSDKLLEREIARFPKWLIWSALISPKLELMEATAKELGEGTKRIRLVVQNTGW